MIRNKRKRLVQCMTFLCVSILLSREATLFAKYSLGSQQEQEHETAPTKHSGNVHLRQPDSNRSSIQLSKSSLVFLSSMNLTRDDFYQRNHFYRAWMTNLGASESSKSQHLLPMDIMTQYISEHSHQRLELEWKEACGEQEHPSGNTVHSDKSTCRLDDQKSSRKYLVASYSCPLESGNRLHRYMNGLMWAVLTNRTFLWRYQNCDVCKEYNEVDCDEQYNRNLIKGPSDCEGLIERSPWIPSYDEWKDKLGFRSDNSDLVRAEISPKIVDNTTLPYDGISDNIRLIRAGFQVELNPGGILTDEPVDKAVHLTNNENLKRLKAISSKGVYFLYGMLFESLFTIDPSLDPPENLLHPASNRISDHNNSITIFLHSRHPKQWPEDYIKHDHLCLEKMLSIQYPANEKDMETPTHKQRPCHIYVMSDRPVTVELLHKDIQNYTHCTSSSRSQTIQPAPSANLVPKKKKRTKNGNTYNTNVNKSLSFRAEHGPRAGRGFWEDVALATHARDGMIAVHKFRRDYFLVRTSTAMVREIVEFRRNLEHHYCDIFFERKAACDATNKSDRDLSGFFECVNAKEEDIWKLPTYEERRAAKKAAGIGRYAVEHKNRKREKKRKQK